MQAMDVNGVTLHWRSDGPDDGPALVFSNSLGTDLRIWDPLLPHLAPGWRLVRYDKRGHGLSDLPPDIPGGEWGMGDHVADLMGLLDGLGVTDAVICGLSVGGIIAQGMAAERPDLVRAIILCDTGAKIGEPAMWDDRIRTVREKGIAAMADGVMERWFTPAFRADRAEFPLYRNMLVRTTPDGYAGTCAAIRDTDLRESTARLSLPCLGICGDQDGATPPDLVRETTALIAGSRFELIRGAGHIPCVEQSEALAAVIGAFLSGLDRR